MKRRRDLTGLAGVLVLLVLAPMLGLAPQMHAQRQAQWQARAAQQAGQHEQAAEYLAKAAEAIPERPGLWEQAGFEAARAAKYDLALKYFEQASQKQPGGLSPAGLLSLGQVYVQMGRLEGARLTWERLEELDPAQVPLRELYQLQRQAGELNSAQSNLERYLAQQPQDAQAWFELGQMRAASDPGSALEALAQAQALDAGLSGAIEGLSRSIRAAQGEEPAYMLLNAGQALAGLGVWDLAEAAFARATELRPDFADAWAYLGEARQQHPTPGEEKAGYAELQQALTLDPDSLAAHLLLSLYWRRLGDYEQAIQAQQAALRLAPQNPALVQGLGELQAASGDLAAAQASYQLATTLAPDDPQSWRELGRFALRYDYQLRESGLPAARQALLLATANPDSLDLMGQILVKLNDLQGGRRFLEQAVQADAGHGPAHLHLGYVLWLLGQPNAAREEWQLARSLAPESAAAQQAARLLRMYFP